ncbi:MAG: acyl-CoA thioesterase [Flavobacteriia bacterium]|nr:MAG: acyl-CoA thioesterase [Flavobacteriia bacterium]
MKNIFPENTISYKHKYRVKPEDIDTLDHVNNVVYLKWVNEISEKHWGILSNTELDKKYFWVAIRHEIDYLHPAFLNDQITIYTWIGKTVGVRSIRHVHIYREDTLLAKAQTTWCLMDVKTKKITRIGKEIMDILL